MYFFKQNIRDCDIFFFKFHIMCSSTDILAEILLVRRKEQSDMVF